MQALDLKVRLRSDNEAFNLGLMLARRYYFALLLAALPLWSLCLGLGLVFWYGKGSPLYLLLLLWWLKPLYERPMLLRLSRLIFQQAVDVKIEQKAAFASGWLAEMTYLRLFRGLAPIRHAVNCLEDLRGKEKRERLRFFARGAAGAMRALLLISLLETALLLIGAWLFFDVSIHNLAAFLQRLLYAPEELHLFLALAYVPLSLLVSPFYIGAGFMDYLNFRMISEGWVVALDMRRLAARLLPCVVALILGLCVFAAPPTYAVNAADVAADRAWVQAEVESKNGPYGQARLNPKDGSLDLPNLPNGDFSQAVKWGLIGLSALLLLWIVWQIARGGGAVALRSPTAARPKAEISFAERQAALETLAAARQYANSGELLKAVAILYGHWRQDFHHYRLPAINSDETESEYFARIQNQASGAQAQFLQQLFALWQQGAYAKRSLDKVAVLHLLDSYQGLWRQV